MPKICEMLLNLEGFQYSMSLVLNIGYDDIRLRDQASNVCTIILPWREYNNESLKMSVCNSPDIFQEKISNFFHGFEFIRAYINDSLIITKGDLSDNLNKLERVL